MQNKIIGLILGAGKSERMNGYPKPLVKKDGKTFIENIYDNIIEAGINKILLVTGYKNEIIKKNTEHLKYLTTVYNSNYEYGQFSSLQTGLQFIKENIDYNYILLTLCDIPFVKKEVYKLLISEAEHNKIVIPSYNHKRGHPVLFDKYFVDKFLSATIEQNAKFIINNNLDKIKYIQVNDENVLKDIDYYNELAD